MRLLGCLAIGAQIAKGRPPAHRRHTQAGLFLAKPAAAIAEIFAVLVNPLRDGGALAPISSIFLAHSHGTSFAPVGGRRTAHPGRLDGATMFDLTADTLDRPFRDKHAAATAI